MTAESSDELYEKVWGEEAPHPPADLSAAHPPADHSADRVESPAPMVGELVIAASRDAASQNGSMAAGAPPSTTPAPRSTIMLQHQMAETLRRLEARVGDLQQQVQPFTKTTVRESIQAAEGLSAELAKAGVELKGMIEYAHRIIQELADLQAQAHQGMALIDGRLKELERPRRFFN